tara:strand:+ start:522 stop:758 length:237 start_codon:yes stop_codon:yes gene_type:complete
MTNRLDDLGTLVTVGEACAVLFGKDTISDRMRIYRWIKSGVLDATKYGQRRFYIHRDELERFSRAQKKGAETPPFRNH